MLSLVRISLVLVSLLLGLLLSAALPPEEWLLSRSKWIDSVNNEQSPDVQRFDEKNNELSPDVQRFDEESVNTQHSPDVQRFDEESYTSPKKVPAEADQATDVFAAEANSEISLSEIPRRQYRQYPHRPQCRFAGCGK